MVDMTVIGNMLELLFTPEVFNSLKTKNGQTQKVEEKYKNIVREVLDELNIGYREVGSQTPGDFRLDGGIVLECKKTDSFNIYFNDSVPTLEWNYLFIYTGSKKYSPRLILTKGNQIITNEKKQLLDKEKERLISSKISNDGDGWTTYPRITVKLNIKNLPMWSISEP